MQFFFSCTLFIHLDFKIVLRVFVILVNFVVLDKPFLSLRVLTLKVFVGVYFSEFLLCRKKPFCRLCMLTLKAFADVYFSDFL